MILDDPMNISWAPSVTCMENVPVSLSFHIILYFDTEVFQSKLLWSANRSFPSFLPKNRKLYNSVAFSFFFILKIKASRFRAPTFVVVVSSRVSEIVVFPVRKSRAWVFQVCNSKQQFSTFMGPKLQFSWLLTIKLQYSTFEAQETWVFLVCE